MTNISKSIDCIITAAGFSSRMGEWKMAMPYKNTTILDTSINNALKFCERIILVVGFRGDELIEKYQGVPGVTVVQNTCYESGLKSSVVEGIKQVESDYFFITHGDMPFISKDIFESLWQARHSGVVFPGSEKSAGHPVLISAELKTRLIEESQLATMKQVLFNCNTKFLSLPIQEITIDIDTQSDYTKWCKR